MGFEKNVFINCPFDDKYRQLLRPLLFTVIYLGLTPRITLETLDSAESRIEKIVALIRQSQYGIHDLSRIKAEKRGEYYRFNMPFELGLDMGCRRFKSGKWSKKKCLILEAKKYRYQAALSDLSNSDIEVHRNAPVEVVRVVRNWLAAQARLAAPGPAKIWGAFNDFMAANYDDLIAKGYSPRNIRQLPVDELMSGMNRWVRKNVFPVKRARTR
jgi:hypothetical protein